MEKRIKLCVETYKTEKNIKKVAEITGIKWQTVYWYLKKANVVVCGDKSRYGSIKDRFAHEGEKYIENLIPESENQNNTQFQPPVDFIIGSYEVEVKSAKLKNKWAFSLKKQIKKADFFILLGYDVNGEEVLVRFIIPRELLRESLQSISIGKDYKKSKWNDFYISEEDLKKFFKF